MFGAIISQVLGSNGVLADGNHVQCTNCRCQLPKQNAPPVPTRCQFCAKTLCDAFKRSAACVPPGFPTLGAQVACAAGPIGRLRPVREHEIVYPLGVAAMRHNPHETKILQDYLSAKGKSVRVTQ